MLIDSAVVGSISQILLTLGDSSMADLFEQTQSLEHDDFKHFTEKPVVYHDMAKVNVIRASPKLLVMSELYQMLLMNHKSKVRLALHQLYMQHYTNNLKVQKSPRKALYVTGDFQVGALTLVPCCFKLECSLFRKFGNKNRDGDVIVNDFELIKGFQQVLYSVKPPEHSTNEPMPPLRLPFWHVRPVRDSSLVNMYMTQEQITVAIGDTSESVWVWVMRNTKVLHAGDEVVQYNWAGAMHELWQVHAWGDDVFGSCKLHEMSM